jgi:hypothetical protein
MECVIEWLKAVSTWAKQGRKQFGVFSGRMINPLDRPEASRIMKNHVAFHLITMTKTTLKVVMQGHWKAWPGAAHNARHSKMSDKSTRWKFDDDVFRTACDRYDWLTNEPLKSRHGNGVAKTFTAHLKTEQHRALNRLTKVSSGNFNFG